MPSGGFKEKSHDEEFADSLQYLYDVGILKEKMITADHFPGMPFEDPTSQTIGGPSSLAPRTDEPTLELGGPRSLTPDYEEFYKFGEKQQAAKQALDGRPSSLTPDYEDIYGFEKQPARQATADPSSLTPDSEDSSQTTNRVNPLGNPDVSDFYRFGDRPQAEKEKTRQAFKGTVDDAGNFVDVPARKLDYIDRQYRTPKTSFDR